MNEKLEDKEKILKQLNDIHNCLIVDEKAVPYSKYTLLLWGIVSVILFLSFELILGFGLFYAILYVVSVILISQLVDYYITIKKNIQYDLIGITAEQSFIKVVYSMSVFFAIILTYIFVSNSLGYYSYPVWVFMLSFTNILIGFILNNKIFKLVGFINILIAIIMFAMFSFSEIDYFILANYMKYISSISVGLSYFYIAFNGMNNKSKIID